MALSTFCLGLFKCLSCFVNGKKLFPLVNVSVICHSTLNICLIFGVEFICLPGTLMILKSACSHNASYIDRLISVFMRSLQKMVREHLSPQQANPGVTETSTGTCLNVKKHQTQRLHHKRSIGYTHLVVKSNKCHFYSVGVSQHAFTLLG